MKKIIAIFLLLACMLPAFAAYQYDNYVTLNGTSLSVTQNANLTLSFQSAITQWSTLTTVITKSNGEVVTSTVNISGNEVNIGNVSAGDSIKFVLANPNDKTTDNMTFWGSGWDTEENTYEYLHFGANHGTWGGQYTNQQFQISGTPAGQPLPGVAAALLLSGGILGANGWRSKRKQRKVTAEANTL